MMQLERALVSSYRPPYILRATTYAHMLSPVRLSVCLSVRHRGGSVKTLEFRIVQLSPLTPVSSQLTSPRNSKGNIGSEGAK